MEVRKYMNEQKQIEEMRSDLIEIFDEEYEKRRLITPQNTAEKLTAKGYRKQIEGEWVEVQREWDFYPFFYIDFTCSVCGSREQNKRKFCPNCGARMKGEKENV